MRPGRCGFLPRREDDDAAVMREFVRVARPAMRGKIRLGAEGDDAGEVERIVDSICDAVREAV